MQTLKDLKTLERLLKEFGFPVSPILEYAMRSKEEELLAACEPVEEVSEDADCAEEKDSDCSTYPEETLNVYIRKSGRTVLRVIRPDGSIIEEQKAASTMALALKEIGAERVVELNIPLDGMNLVTLGGNPMYKASQVEVGGGYFVNTHSNTITKKRQLERIFRTLKMEWRVEIV